MDLARTLLREPDVTDARHYRRRVTQLAALYVAVFLLSLAGLVLLVGHGRLFVTLSQRSNVETLTIAFFILLFAYLALLSSRGAWGAVRVAAYRIQTRLARDALVVERRKIAVLGERRKGPMVALNRTLERGDRPGEAFELTVADAAGPVGTLRVDGVRVQHLAAHRDGSNDLLSFFVRQVSHVAGEDPDDLEIVHFKSIDDQGFFQYVTAVDAMRELGRRTGDGSALWPHLALTAEQCRELERRLSPICPAVRDEAFLPQLEYQGEHKLPIIPEPLGIVSLQRTERRVDALSSLFSVSLLILVVLALIVFFIARPPWVPGH